MSLTWPQCSLVCSMAVLIAEMVRKRRWMVVHKTRITVKLNVYCDEPEVLTLKLDPALWITAEMQQLYKHVRHSVKYAVPTVSSSGSGRWHNQTDYLSAWYQLIPHQWPLTYNQETGRMAVEPTPDPPDILLCHFASTGSSRHIVRVNCTVCDSDNCNAFTLN